MKIIITTILLFIQACLSAQYDIEWIKQYGGSRQDGMSELLVTQQGDLLVLGFSNSSDMPGHLGSSDIILTKFSIEGNLIWQKHYGTTGYDYSSSIIETTDGYLIAGHTTSPGSYEIVLYNIDFDGTINWENTYGGQDADWLPHVIATRDGGYAIAFTSWSDDTWPNHGSGDILLMKLDSNGNIEWNKNFGGSDLDQAESIIQSKNGDFIIAGNTRSSDDDIEILHSEQDYWLVSISEQGALKWQETYGGGQGNNVLRKVVTLPDEGYLLCGQHGGDDVWIIKVDLLGNFIWQNSFGGLGIEAFSELAIVNDEYVGCGFTESLEGEIIGDSERDAFIFKLDNNGELISAKSFGGTGEDVASSIKTVDDVVYLAGYTSSEDGDMVNNNLGLTDIWIAKLNPSPVANKSLDPQSTLRLYPNPSSNKITIETTDSDLGLKFSISNMKGQNILGGIINTVSQEITTKSWSTGLYAFNIYRKDAVHSVKFLVAR